MKFLIIGSKGFIGSNLAKYLISLKYQVFESDVVIDYEKQENYFLVDATNANYHDIFQQVTFDVCVNCSGAASVYDSLNNPHRDFQLNTVNVFKLLDAIRHYQPECRYINISSAAVYGNPMSLPVKESDQLNAISPYGYHKVVSEQICEEFHRFFKMKTCNLRIFSAYGEGLKKQLFWDLWLKASKSTEVKLFGTGRESRDFIYIGDLVHAILLVALNAKFNGESINIANGNEVTIEEAVKTFYSIFDKKIEVSFSGESRPGDPNNWRADIQKINDLGYKPVYSLKQGLQNYYQWLKTRG
ncbi:MAG: GDP-mannose 4,6-dehydratase [Lentimicrobiaceae bacterium]|nr:GDP-mannose 4,6-dehydratase [Lentimicrobiaceae bacterium]